MANIQTFLKNHLIFIVGLFGKGFEVLNLYKFVKQQKNLSMTEHHLGQSYQSLQLATYKSQGNFHADVSRQLDLQYLSLRERIVHSKHYSQTSKHMKIRLNGWLKKLDQIISNPIWKRNRNTYAKLMNLMCECEIIVEPFMSLPPQTDIPKLNKHQTNRIIDQVQRQIKQDKTFPKGSTKDKNERVSQVRPEQYWSKIKRQSANSKQINIGSQSINLDKFTSIEEKCRQPLKYSNFNEQFLFMTEGTKSLKTSQKKKVYFSDVKDQNSNKKVQSSQGKENNPFLKTYGKPPKHITLSLNPKQGQSISAKKFNGSSSSEFKQSALQDISKVSRLQAYRDGHISMQLQNQTLKTEMFDPDLSIHPQMMQYFCQISLQESDYTDQLSQRLRIKQGDENRSYFAQKLQQKTLKCYPLLPM